MKKCALLALLFLGVAQSYAQPIDKIQNMFKWVEDMGGVVSAEVKINQEGYRGLFATKSFKKGEYIASIPASCIMNVGGISNTFAVPTLHVLRELKNPHSRFKPYIDMWPAPHEVVNACNLDSKYLQMYKHPHWEKSGANWEYYLDLLLKGQLDPDLEYTIQETVGNATVTLEDLKYACAISSTRYVAAQRRKRLIMAPVFDLANHDRHCAHTISQYDKSDVLHIVAGADVQAGDEICYSYGHLRDDYAVSHYGFLPRLEDPPRLALVDHRDFKEDEQYSHETPPSEEPFTGSPEEVSQELQRLRRIYEELRATPDPLPPQPKGQDYTYDLLKGLEERRLNALQYEIRRLSGLLDERAEL